MYVDEKLKLNKFRVVNIPENKDYFSRYGFLQMPANAYSGDDVSRMPGTKIDEIEAGLAYDQMKQREELEKSQ